MNIALKVEAPLSEPLPINIEAIKKAFIQMHQLSAANEQVIRPSANNDHVMKVKDWVQDSERELGVKARVYASPMELGLTPMTPGAVVNNEPVLFANYIDNQKMALDLFEYVAVGLLGIESLLKGKAAYTELYSALPQDTKEYMAKKYDLDLSDSNNQTLMIKLYFADLAALNIKLTWLERRDAWQRQIVRKLYPKLGYNSLDLHYMLLKARRLVRKQHK